MDDQAQKQSDNKAAEKAAREAAWWEHWREQDFSWAGLAALDAYGRPKHRWIGWSVSPDKRCVETAKAPEGSRPATLQDYFRQDPDTGRMRSDQALRDASLLIGDTGQADFHILHLPETHADRTPSFKADLDAAEWGVLEEEVSRRLVHSGATDKTVSMYGFKGADHRVQFTGAILRRFPRPPAPAKVEHARPQLHLCADRSAWLDNADASRIDFASPLSMATVLFKGSAYFYQAQFSGGYAKFNQAQFSGGYADFYHAQFSGGDAKFNQAQLSGGNAYFTKAQFSGGYADFYHAQFSGGYAKFNQAQFSGGDAKFNQAQFSGGDADFNQAHFFGGYANFNQAHFSGGDAKFNQAQFSGGYADFNQVQFSGGCADFNQVQFSGGYAKFSQAQFSGGYADFYHAQFSGGDAKFNQVQFSGGYANFNQAQFSGGNAYFSGILALGDVNLARGELSGTEAGELRHSNAPGDTSARASEGTTQSGRDVSQIWLTTPGARAEAGALASFKLGNARIFGTADFSDRVFSSEPDFEGVKFFGRSSFHGVSLHEGVRWKMARFRFGTPMRPRRFPGWDRAWRQVDATVRSWLGRKAPHAPDYIPFPSREELWDEIERRAGDGGLPDKARAQFNETYDAAKARFDDRGLEANLYESDYRTLKRLSAKIGASAEEQRFFALELKARQARRLTGRSDDEGRDTDVTAWEAVFARLYGAVTDYGQSLTRVLGWMGVVWLASAASYLALAVTAPPLPAPQTPVALHQTPRLIGAQEDASPTDDRWTAYWRQEGRTGLLGPALYGLEMTVVPVVNPGGHHPWTRRLEGPNADGHAYWFALVRLIHRLLALPLAFLFLLTLRRRFQIS
ncbi:pentapeptide repeat-containing protein [Maricaulis maris]|uniref:Uncharacterized protein YjbI with pentapeptide repeats n=1 Tax=Maricaulis maris TaxID=74318 RepID=A0A495D1C4_9PROT|nr:pentapeptide repeat-containing protein [Maricaulis maris]RKQ95308.1 uncharacterized protein YjbI with pentapeptide repeats [Maricaulis maris]